MISICDLISLTHDLISSRLKNISPILISTTKNDFHLLRKIIPNHPMAMSGDVIVLISIPNHQEIPIYQTSPSKSVVPMLAPRIMPMACVNHKTQEPTSANVIKAVIAELCNTAVARDPVRIAPRFVLVKVLSKVLIPFDVFAKPLSNTSKLNNKNPIHASKVRIVVDIYFKQKRCKKIYYIIVDFFQKDANFSV